MVPKLNLGVQHAASEGIRVTAQQLGGRRDSQLPKITSNGWPTVRDVFQTSDIMPWLDSAFVCRGLRWFPLHPISSSGSRGCSLRLFFGSLRVSARFLSPRSRLPRPTSPDHHELHHQPISRDGLRPWRKRESHVRRDRLRLWVSTSADRSFGHSGQGRPSRYSVNIRPQRDNLMRARIGVLGGEKPLK